VGSSGVLSKWEAEVDKWLSCSGLILICNLLDSLSIDIHMGFPTAFFSLIPKLRSRCVTLLGESLVPKRGKFDFPRFSGLLDLKHRESRKSHIHIPQKRRWIGQPPHIQPFFPISQVFLYNRN